MTDKLTLTILGGNDHTGSTNCMALEYGNDMILIDLGLGFPEFDQFGVDYLIPNLEYVKERKEKLRGIIITHGHLDHIGGLPYFMEDLDWPEIHAPKMADALIKLRAEEFGQTDNMKLRIYDGSSKLDIGNFKISFARINHNIPDSYSVFVDTPVGKIIHTGDWKFDNNPYKEPPTEFHKFTQASKEGVLLLCSDSTNALKRGWSDSESAITPQLEEVIEKANGRVIASTFASLITRLVQVIDISKRYGRKIVVSGRSMENTVDIALKMGLIKESENLFITAKAAAQMPSNKVTILATGSQGEETSSLVRMSTGTHPEIQLQKDDTVILSSSVIPGNELSVYRLRDDLAKKGVTVFHNDLMDVHAGGHPHQEDLKMMIHLTKPRFLMPIQGSASFRASHKKAAMDIGINEQNIVMADNGSQTEVSKDLFQILDQKVTSYPILVDGLGVGDTGPELLKERAKLADDGVVFITFPFDSGGRIHPGGEVRVITKGFIYTANNQDLVEDVKKVVRQAISKKGGEEKKLKRVESMVSEFLHQKTRKSPVVIVVGV